MFLEALSAFIFTAFLLSGMLAKKLQLGAPFQLPTGLGTPCTHGMSYERNCSHLVVPCRQGGLPRGGALACSRAQGLHVQ